eukprot:TRINITY_DN32882_c0_g1_i1.p5 TRINITY_DN32882_c0_g1~~TRINITY_DN32882_c0_g1_i1.p5  ORF type:complete len:106 (-),score=2.69 TRINITY_DN32882_c0_g1_i1:559-876(-)
MSFPLAPAATKRITQATGRPRRRHRYTGKSSDARPHSLHSRACRQRPNEGGLPATQEAGVVRQKGGTNGAPAGQTDGIAGGRYATMLGAAKPGAAHTVGPAARQA